MKILVTNDDGIAAKGLRVLAQALTELGEVTVVAPAVERSATGHAITLYDPLRVEKFYIGDNFFGYAVNGTPADCVKIAARALMNGPPDMVFSGINPGTNIGTNAIYSGTVSAAIEGSIIGSAAMAISMTREDNPNYPFAAQTAVKLAKKIIEKGLSPEILLNVNIPNRPSDQIKGFAITRQGKSKYHEYFDKRVDPQKREYYWLTGKMTNVEDGEDVDFWAIKNGYISITPLQYDLTNYRLKEQLTDWKF
jgi:5'/3'-nucleotidase